MSTTQLATVSLPRGLEALDVAGVIERLQQQALFVTSERPNEKKSRASKRSSSSSETERTLPHLDALPPMIERPLKRLELLGKTLSNVLVKRQTSAVNLDSELDPDKAKEDSNGVWRGFSSWLEGWSLIADTQTPSSEKIRALRVRLFPDEPGLTFIRWRSSKRWGEMSTRMTLLEQSDVKSVIASLGGQRWLDQLEKAHEAYGRAFHFTTPTKQSSSNEPADDLFVAYQAAMNGLRDYVRKVSAYGDPELEGSVELSDYLLQPFVELQNEFARREAGKKKGTKPEGDPQPK